MNILQLKEKLDALGVSELSYSLCGEPKDECYVLEADKQKGYWFYYSERGLRNNELYFPSEAEACDFLWSVISDDKTTRKK